MGDDTDEFRVPPPIHGDTRYHVRRKIDISAGEAIGVLAKKASGLQHLIVLMVTIGAIIGGTLVWLGYKQQSPAEAIAGLQAQVDAVRKDGLQRDTLIHQIAKGVAMLTYYRCTEENVKAQKDGRPLIDCLKIYQDGEK